MPDKLFIVGADISPAHFAFVDVQIDLAASDPIGSAMPLDWWFMADRAKYISKKRPNNDYRSPKVFDKEIGMMERMNILARCTYLSSQKMDLGAIEGFAYEGTGFKNAHSRSPYEIGGVGYLVRRGWWKMNLPFRAYNPTQLKKFVCHKGSGFAKGTAKKISMEKARSRWPEAIAFFDCYDSGAASNNLFEDLVDAFSVGVLGGVEWMLRSGYLEMRSLLHDKEREIFNGVSKTEPENLLTRPLTVKTE